MSTPRSSLGRTTTPPMLALLTAIGVLTVAGLAVASGPGRTRAGAQDGSRHAAQGRSDRGAAAASAAPDASPLPPPPLPAVARVQRPHPPAILPPDAFSGAQARAYAALGLAQDGRPEALAALDAEASRCLAAMRAGLARSRPTPGAASAASIASIASDGGAARVGGTDAGTGPAATGGAGGHLDFGAVDRGIGSDADGLVITGTQVWALARLQPDQGRLAIADHSGGAYVVSLDGGDFSTIRLNGGLVVPGRAYALSGSAVITGAVPCAVSIRPAAAVTTSYASPLLPTGDG